MEKWKDKIMNSLEGIEKAQPKGDVFLKIQRKISEQKIVNKRQLIAVAATISLVICANVYFISNYNSSVTIPEPGDSYLGIISNFNIYE